MGQGISHAFGAMIGRFGAIIAGLGGLVGGGLIGAGLGIGIGFATGNPVIGVCVGFGTCLTGLFIGWITGGLIGICIGGHS